MLGHDLVTLMIINHVVSCACLPWQKVCKTEMPMPPRTQKLLKGTNSLKLPQRHAMTTQHKLCQAPGIDTHHDVLEPANIVIHSIDLLFSPMHEYSSEEWPAYQTMKGKHAFTRSNTAVS